MAAIVDKNGMCLADVAAAQTHIRRRTKTAYRRWRACCVSSAANVGCLSGQARAAGVGCRRGWH